MKKRFAIIGVAFELPGGIVSHDRLWDVLVSDEDVFSPIPRSRVSMVNPFVAKLHSERRAPLLENVEYFDHHVFRMSKREADSISPAQKKNLSVAFRAIENARMSVSSMDRGTGVFVTDPGDDFLYSVRCKPEDLNSFHNLNVSIATMSGRISNAFGLSGPSVTVSTACSSSVYALQNAIWAIGSGYCETAIVTAVNLFYGSLKSVFHDKSSMISPTGRCHSFKAEADGYVRAEAAVALLIKELSNAIKDNDEIHAVIESIYVNHNGFSDSMKQPQVSGVESCIREAIRASGLNPEDIHMVEGHGAGTTIGDRVEVEAIKNVMKHKVALTAVKSYFGHPEGASGLVSLCKAIECVKRQVISPIFRYTTPSKNYDLGNLMPVKKPLAWPEKKRYALICNYGFSGSNGAIVISNA